MPLNSKPQDYQSVRRPIAAVGTGPRDYTTLTRDYLQDEFAIVLSKMDKCSEFRDDHCKNSIDQRIMFSFFSELKRRNVIKVAAAYLIVAWLLLQVSATLAPALLLPEWFHSGVALLLILGFPVALILAWAFELTPDGLKKDDDAGSSKSQSVLDDRKLNIILACLLALSLAYLGFERYEGAALQSTATIEEPTTELADATVRSLYPSIAVLPFANLSDDDSNQYFSEGLSVELRHLLDKIPELRVAAGTSSSSFRDQQLAITAIAELLNVTHVLEGSVRKAGLDIRVIVQLVDGQTGNLYWSESYNQKLENIFALQDEIASDIVNQLRVKLTGAMPMAYATNPEAYRLFLQGTYLTGLLDNTKNDQAESMFRQALQIDPAYAPAWRELARILGRQIGSGPAGYYDVQRIRDTLDRALEISPGDAPSLAYSAWGLMKYDGNFDGAARRFETALTIAPTNEDVLRTAAIFAIAFAHPDSGISLSTFAAEHNPLCFACQFQMVRAYLFAARLGEAETSARELINVFGSGHEMLGQALLLKAQPESALEHFALIENPDRRRVSVMLAYYDLNRTKDFDEAMRQLVGASYGSRLLDLASVYAYTDQIDQSFEILDTVLAQSETELNGETVRWNYLRIAEISRDPLFDNLRLDERWQQYLAEYGISSEQLEALQFEPSLPARQ